MFAAAKPMSLTSISIIGEFKKIAGPEINFFIGIHLKSVFAFLISYESSKNHDVTFLFALSGIFHSKSMPTVQLSENPPYKFISIICEPDYYRLLFYISLERDRQRPIVS